MAKKINALRLAQLSRGHAEITNRRILPASPSLGVMQLRLPRLRISLPAKKLPVTVEPSDRAQIEHPVRIRHVARNQDNGTGVCFYLKLPHHEPRRA